MRRGLPLVLVVAVLAGVLPLALPTAPVHAAATFVVNRVGDQADPKPGDHRCDVDVANGDQCTLRAAIQQANHTSGADTIAFNIPGTGVHTIVPATDLPAITQRVTIDGYTQRPCTSNPAPCSRPNTSATRTNAQLLIQLSGTGGAEFGLVIRAANTVVRGLAVNNFRGDPAGVGIEIDGPTTTGVRIVGCFLGTDPGGTLERGNDWGIRVRNGARVTIGGTTPAARNLISGNGDGVGFLTAGPNSVVQGNLIGTTKAGTAALGNAIDGIRIVDTANTVIGGDVAGSLNTIAFNNRGVAVLGTPSLDMTTGNRILRNRIFANGGIGIDLGNDGPTPNDHDSVPPDADTGPNTLQNYPELDDARTSNGVTTIEGQLRSSPDQRFVLRFFSNPDGADEGRVFRGQQAVVTDSNGSAFFTFKPAQAIPVGQTVTATATNAGGNTSEFSFALGVSG